MSIGRFARTVWELDPRQVAGRVGFRARRTLWPAVAALPSLPARLPRFARREGLPATCPLDDADLEALAGGVLRLAGHESVLPLAAPFEPEETDPLYRYQLHEHGWLREAMSRAPGLRPRLASWLDRYVASHFASRAIALDPYPLATRMREHQGLVALGLASAASLAQPMADATRLLLGLSETHLLANHLLRDRAALVCGAAWIDGPLGAPLRRHALASFVRECDAQFGRDGMHEERCPAYHAHALADILFALDAIEAGPDEPAGERDRGRDALRTHAERALAALSLVTHEDGLVAAFGDSAPRSAPSTAAFEAWADVLGLHASSPPREACGPAARSTLPVSGFSVVAGDGYRAYLSHGPFGAPAQPGHAHCDLFALELDVAGRRVIVDPGVHAYHEPSLRQASRTGRAHATPVLEGPLAQVEQAEIWSRFRCGWRPRSIEARWQDDALIGEARAFGPHHAHTLRRTVRFGVSGLRVEDAIDGASDVSSALPLAPGLTVVPSGHSASIRDGGRPVLEISLLSEGALSVEEAEVSHRFGERLPASRLRLRGAGRLEYTLTLAPQ